MGVRTTDRWTAFGEYQRKQIKALASKPYVKIGVLSRDFDKPKDEEAPKRIKGFGRVHKYKKGATNGEVAVYNEFGTADGHIPERSFIRSTWDAKAHNLDAWAGLAKVLKEKIVKGEITVARALSIMGAKIKADYQEKIRSNVPPPNAPATLAAKFPKTNTLINTGQLLNSLAFEVHDRHEL